MKARHRLVALPLAAALLSACSPFTRIEGDANTAGKLDGRWAVRYVAGKGDPQAAPGAPLRQRRRHPQRLGRLQPHQRPLQL